MTTQKKFIDTFSKTSRGVHNINGRIFPFYTRNPERVKYKDDFTEIVGMVARYSVGKQMVLEDLSNVYGKKLLESIDSRNVTSSEIKEIFSINFNEVQNPFMLSFYPVKNETKKERDELKGKKMLAAYITHLFKLDENEEWKSFIQKNSPSDLYEEVIINNLPELNENKEKEEKFHFFDQNRAIKLFSKDLKVLLKNEKLFLKYISLFISYYYFNYIIQQLYNLTREERTNFVSWYVFDKEKVSSGRNAVKQGYPIIQGLSKELLINDDLLQFLNEIVQSKNFMSFSDIVKKLNSNTSWFEELRQFNSKYAEYKELEYEDTGNVSKQINQLREYLGEANISEAAIVSRYRKSFDEFVNLSFIKRRGRYGYILNASQDLILMFVIIIIGEKKRILIRDLFNEFEFRGLYFDKASKKEILAFFEEINILDKLSDSGDAQYVRTIL